MIKVMVIKEFTFAKYNEIKNLVSKDKVEDKRLFVGDMFECDKATCDYLSGNNPANVQVVEIIEVIPEQVESKPIEPIIEKKEIKKPSKKKSSKK